MKFIIGVDLEGIACVVGESNTKLSNTRNYEFTCRQAVREVNAAARALFDCGAEQVIVWDNHGDRPNLNYDDLDYRCDILLGLGAKHRWACIDESFTGVLLIGYHSKDNTLNAVLPHTYNGDHQWVKVNGVEVGEMEIDAAVAGEYDVPIIFVSSDEAGIKEAKSFMPWIETVTTKKAFARNMALSKNPKKVAEEIYEATSTAISKLKHMKPFVFENPINLEIRFRRPEVAQQRVNEGKSIWSYKEPYVLECNIDKISDYF